MAMAMAMGEANERGMWASLNSNHRKKLFTTKPVVPIIPNLTMRFKRGKLMGSTVAPRFVTVDGSGVPAV